MEEIEIVNSTYANEKFYQALHALAASPKSIQLRLADAAIYLVRVQPADHFPDGRREAFGKIIHSLTYKEARGDEGQIRATTLQMTDQEASSVAESILSFYVDLKGGI